MDALLCHLTVLFPVPVLGVDAMQTSRKYKEALGAFCVCSRQERIFFGVDRHRYRKLQAEVGAPWELSDGAFVHTGKPLSSCLANPEAPHLSPAISGLVEQGSGLLRNNPREGILVRSNRVRNGQGIVRKARERDQGEHRDTGLKGTLSFKKT